MRDYDVAIYSKAYSAGYRAYQDGYELSDYTPGYVATNYGKHPVYARAFDAGYRAAWDDDRHADEASTLGPDEPDTYDDVFGL